MPSNLARRYAASASAGELSTDVAEVSEPTETGLDSVEVDEDVLDEVEDPRRCLI